MAIENDGKELCLSCKKGHYWFNNHCGARVCDHCRNHKHLARCFCGWSESGGDGRRELVEMGEQIDDDY